jgi:hypothetical protein
VRPINYGHPHQGLANLATNLYAKHLLSGLDRSRDTRAVRGDLGEVRSRRTGCESEQWE